MYQTKIITRPDGTKYSSSFWTHDRPQTWSDEQEAIANCLSQLGTNE